MAKRRKTLTLGLVACYLLTSRAEEFLVVHGYARNGTGLVGVISAIKRCLGGSYLSAVNGETEGQQAR